MTPEELDPPRLDEQDSSASPTLKALLASAKANGAPRERLGRVHAAVLARRAPTTGSTQAATRTLSAKLTVGALVGALLAGAAFVAWQRRSEIESGPRSHAPASHAARERTAPTPTSDGPRGAAEPSIPAPADPALQSPGLSTPSANAPARVRPAEPSPEAARARRLAPSSAAPPTRESAPGLPTETELALLSSGRSALLAGNYARATSLLDAHARRYPTGMLSEEREALRVEALWRADHREAAQARFASFERTFAGSPYSRRLRALLEN